MKRTLFEISIVFAHFIYLTIGCFFVGYVSRMVFHKITFMKTRSKILNVFKVNEFINSMWWGFIINIFLLQLIYLFQPINNLLWKISFFGGCIILLLKFARKDFKFRFSTYMTLSFVSLCVLLLNSRIKSNYYDLGLYYLPLSKWVETFPVIFGLSNIHDRFAYSPQHIILATSMNNVLTPISGFTLLTGFTAFLCILSNNRLLKTSLNYKKNFTIYLSIGIYFSIVILFTGKNAQTFLTSSSPDSMAIVWTIALLIFASNYYLTREVELLYLALFLSFALFGIRLNTLPLVFFMFILILRNIKNTRLEILILLGTIYVLPNLLIRTIYSGFPFFPMPISFFESRFSIPYSSVISNYKSISESGYGSFSYYFSKFYSFQENSEIRNFLLTILLITLISFLIAVRFVRKSHNFIVDIFIFASSIFPIYFTWIFAPDPRFILFILVTIILIFISFLLYISPLKIFSGSKYLFSAIGALLITTYVLQSYFLTPVEFNSLESKVNDIGTYFDKNGNSIFFNKSSDQCWLIQLPCTPFQDHGRFYFLKDDLKKGVYSY